MLQKEEIEVIKSSHLGLHKPKKLVHRSGDKFRQVFKEDWDAAEDTSIDINPLYIHRKDPQLLFGKGFVGGVDQELQKKQVAGDTSQAVARRMDTSMRNFVQRNEYLTKAREEMSERDWRIFREDNDILIKGGRCPDPVRNWNEVEGLSKPVRENIAMNGFKHPRPIQMQAIPIGMHMRDMIGLAPTGSGKSAAFLLPLIVFLLKQPPIQGNLIQDGPYSIIMAPTRELAQQIEKEFVKLTEGTRLRSVVVVGGKSAEEQGSIISRGVEVVIGTPGRIEDCLKKRTLVLNQCFFFVLDEADKMIDLNLEDSVNFIIDKIPEQIHKGETEELVRSQEEEMVQGKRNYKTFMMFSATMQPLVEKMARQYLKHPSFIQIGEDGASKRDIEERIEFITQES